jgi:hypothetical protein
VVKLCVVSFFFFAADAAAELALKRKLSLPVSKMWQRWVRRSSKAVVIFASPKTLAENGSAKVCHGSGGIVLLRAE